MYAQIQIHPHACHSFTDGTRAKEQCACRTTSSPHQHGSSMQATRQPAAAASRVCMQNPMLNHRFASGRTGLSSTSLLPKPAASLRQLVGTQTSNFKPHTHAASPYQCLINMADCVEVCCGLYCCYPCHIPKSRTSPSQVNTTNMLDMQLLCQVKEPCTGQYMAANAG